MSTTRKQREEVAQKRLLNILAKHGVATARTLEQKISDAGPNNQRIHPHILTPVRNALVKDGTLVRIEGKGPAPWFHLAEADNTFVQSRLAELSPILTQFCSANVTKRTGQTLEIACYKALSETPELRTMGGFRDLHDHDDTTLYSKEEPPSIIGKRSIGRENLDFLSFAGAIPLGIEVKNIREWLYPDRDEIRDALRKALTLDVIPVIVARRIPYVTYRLLTGLGVILHQTFNQLLPASEQELASKVRDKNLLGYHDIRTGNEPDERLLHFFQTNLPALAAQAPARLQYGRDLLEPFANGEMDYDEFAARVRRREQGTNEDGDWDEDADPNDVK